MAILKGEQVRKRHSTRSLRVSPSSTYVVGNRSLGADCGGQRRVSSPDAADRVDFHVIDASSFSQLRRNVLRLCSSRQALANSLTGGCADCTCFIVIVIYEHLVTFDEEVKCFWGTKVTGAVVLFLANRYLNLITNGCLLIALTAPSLTFSLQVRPAKLKRFPLSNFTKRRGENEGSIARALVERLATIAP